jgi:very-short-patch-repair endonuclease
MSVNDERRTSPPIPDRSRPFLRSSALAAGFDPARRPAGLRQVFTGVWVDRSVEIGPRVRIEAALSLHPPSTFASHQSAAFVRGLPVRHGDRPHVSVWQQEHRSRRLGIFAHVACAETKVEIVDGIPVSQPLDLFVELAGVLPFVDVVVVGDAMVRRGMFTVDQLLQFCRSTRRRHIRKARRAAAFVREGVDSPMETRLRMLLVLAGLPEPVVNFKIFYSNGEVRYRLDLSFPDLRVVVEYDGRHHVEDSYQWKADLERREELEAAGWIVIVITSDGLFRNPEKTIRRVARALRRRGVRVDRIDQEWRAHFLAR